AGKPKDFISTRPRTGTARTALAQIDVLVPDKQGFRTLEEKLSPALDAQVPPDLLKPSLRDYDYVLVDMPSNGAAPDVMAVCGLVMSDYVLIPVEPTEMSLNGLPETFELIQSAQGLGGDGSPAIVGMVLTRTDKRTQQFRSQMPAILKAANRGELPPVF